MLMFLYHVFAGCSSNSVAGSRTLAQPDIGSANRASGLLTYTNTDSDAALQCCDVIVA